MFLQGAHEILIISMDSDNSDSSFTMIICDNLFLFFQVSGKVILSLKNLVLHNHLYSHEDRSAWRYFNIYVLKSQCRLYSHGNKKL